MMQEAVQQQQTTAAGPTGPTGPTLPTAAERQAHLAAALATAPHVLVVLISKRQVTPGTTLIARVAFPRTHEDEVYLVLGLDEQRTLAVEPLSQAAATRISQHGTIESFGRWMAIQQWIEQGAFTLCLQMTLLRQAGMGGLILPPSANRF